MLRPALQGERYTLRGEDGALTSLVAYGEATVRDAEESWSADRRGRFSCIDPTPTPPRVPLPPPDPFPRAPPPGRGCA